MESPGRTDKVTRLPLDHGRAAERRRLHIREVSDDGEDVQTTVGDELRAARLRLGEDLRTVASTLRIREEHLAAIEEGAFDRLPARAYALGFVRAYAEYLGLDAAAIVARFKAEAGELPEPVMQPALMDDTVEESRPPQGLFVILLLLFIAALIGGVYFAKTADQLLSQRGADNAPSPAATSTDTSRAAAKPGAVPAPAPAEIAPAASPSAPVPSAPVAAGPVGETALPLPPAGGRVYGATKGPSRVAINALRNGVWLRVEDQTTGEVLITRKLKEGDRYLVPDRPNLLLVTRDGGSLELMLDGVSVGRAGSEGAVIDGLLLNADALAGRLPPAAATTAVPATP